ncbi:MAG TPA: hypothetical protein VJQ46_14300 [Gemmatimonadales bacterium]|nr:hypothetical protein [Gemmatimonadales bacterium]
MNLLIGILIALLPVPLLLFILRTGHYRFCVGPAIAVAAIWAFNCVGAPVVMSEPALATERYAGVMLLAIAMLYVTYAVLFGLGRRVLVSYQDMQADETSLEALPVFLALWVYAGVMLAVYVSRHGAPAIFALAGGLRYIDFYAVRASKLTDLPEGSQWYMLALRTLPFFATVYAYALWRSQPSRWTRLWFWLTLTLTAACALSFATKDALLHLPLLIVIAQLCLAGQQFRFRRLMGYVALSLASVLVIWRFYLLDLPLGRVSSVLLVALWNRLFVIWAEGQSLLVNIIPQNHDYFWGAAFGNPGGLLPFEPVDISRFLGYWSLGHLANYNTASFGQGYANFGLAGVALVLLVMIVQLVGFQMLFRWLPKTPLFLAIYTLFADRMLSYGTQSLQLVFSEEVVLALLIVVAGHYTVRGLVRGAMYRPRAGALPA